LKKILLSNKYTGKPLEIVKSVLPEGFDLEILNTVDQKEFEDRAAEADYILASGRLKISENVLTNAVNLKMIQRTGVGLDSLDTEMIKKTGIPVYVNQGVNSGSVAEHALLLMLSCLRKLTLISENLKKGVWKKQEQGVGTYELSAQVVGLIGMGHIGRRTAELLRPFEAEVLYYDAYRLSDDIEKKLGIRYVSLDELYNKSDIVSLHCPLNDETKHIICKESISRMKDGVIIVNTARGKLINEADIKEALKSGKISFAGLDVFEEEPLKNTELVSLDNVIATPHIAGVTYNAFYRMMHDAMRNIRLFDEGKIADIEKYKLVL